MLFFAYLLEISLWDDRFVLMIAAVASMAAVTASFYMVSRFHLLKYRRALVLTIIGAKTLITPWHQS
jgi:ABC-type maltose transport system permease subunit